MKGRNSPPYFREAEPSKGQVLSEFGLEDAEICGKRTEVGNTTDASTVAFVISISRYGITKIMGKPDLMAQKLKIGVDV